MSAMLIYWTFQIACIVIFIRRKEIPEKHNGRKDSTVRKVLMLVFIPMFAFAYACMGGYPPKDNQVYFIFVVTVVMYGGLIARWIRQNRHTP